MALAEQGADDDEKVDENGGDVQDEGDADDADADEGEGGQGRPHQDR